MDTSKEHPRGKGGLSLNTATVREQWSLAQCIEGCARHGIPGISPWRDKLSEMGVTRAAMAIRDAGLKVSGLCRGGAFTAADKPRRLLGIDDNRRAIAEAAEIGAQCLVMVCGGLSQGSKSLEEARRMVRDGLAEILPDARAAGVRLAIEPLHPMTCADRSVISTLGQALDLCDELGAGMAVAVDVYHVWWDPALRNQMQRAGARIAAFHVCDWLVSTNDTVFDRGMPGDGVIDVPGMRRMAELAGYDGLLEIEILSRNWWAQDPDLVLRTCVERHQAFC